MVKNPPANARDMKDLALIPGSGRAPGGGNGGKFQEDGQRNLAGYSPWVAKSQTGPSTFTRDKEGHYIMTEGSIQEDDVTITKIHAPNIAAPQCMRQMLATVKGELTATRE